LVSLAQFMAVYAAAWRRVLVVAPWPIERGFGGKPRHARRGAGCGCAGWGIRRWGKKGRFAVFDPFFPIFPHFGSETRGFG
jgi:hypothetical protein